VTSLEVSVADHVALVDWIQNRVNNHAADQSANGDSLPSCQRIQFHQSKGKSERESRIESSKFVCPPMGHDEVLLEIVGIVKRPPHPPIAANPKYSTASTAGVSLLITSPFDDHDLGGTTLSSRFGPAAHRFGL
jgi:hypothetical protein